MTEQRIKGVVRKRFRALLDYHREDAMQEIRLATLLYGELPTGEMLKAVSRHFTAVMAKYGYWRPRDRVGRVLAGYQRRELPCKEMSDD